MKVKRSLKALSPVIASIILIAVTVAVSLAVAAWMGALSFGFMATEQGQITWASFTPSANMISVTFNNTGTTKITVETVYVNSVVQPTGNWTCYVGGVATTPAVVPGNSGGQFNITTAVVSGYQYNVKLVSARGNTFVYVGTSPT